MILKRGTRINTTGGSIISEIGKAYVQIEPTIALIVNKCLLDTEENE